MCIVFGAEAEMISESKVSYPQSDLFFPFSDHASGMVICVYLSH